MKFLQHEYNSVKAAIERRGLNYTDFSFIKKKGKLNIIHSPTQQVFIFFRKVETQLTDKLEWEKQTFYYIYSPQKGTPISSWEIVLKKLELWLNQLN